MHAARHSRRVAAGVAAGVEAARQGAAAEGEGRAADVTTLGLELWRSDEHQYARALYP